MTFRHDRPADAPEFAADPGHGFFINRDPSQFQYTIMATGDNQIINGVKDDGLGRWPYFSAPRRQYNRRIGTRRDDNTAKIVKSRDHLQWQTGNSSI